MEAFIGAVQGKGNADVRSSYASAAKKYELTRLIQTDANKHRSPAREWAKQSPHAYTNDKHAPDADNKHTPDASDSGKSDSSNSCNSIPLGNESSLKQKTANNLELARPEP